MWHRGHKYKVVSKLDAEYFLKMHRPFSPLIPSKCLFRPNNNTFLQKENTNPFKRYILHIFLH